MGSSKRHCNDKRQASSRRSRSRSPLRGQDRNRDRDRDRREDGKDRQSHHDRERRKARKDEKNAKNEGIVNVALKKIEFGEINNAIKPEMELKIDTKEIKSSKHVQNAIYDAMETENEFLQDETETKPVSVDIGPVRFEKPNKTRTGVRKPRRISVSDEPEEGVSAETDESCPDAYSGQPPLKFDDSESQLTKLRRITQNRSTKSSKSFVSRVNSILAQTPDETDNCLVFSSGTEFCRSLGEIPTTYFDDPSTLLVPENDNKTTIEDETSLQGGWNEVNVNEEPLKPEVDVSEYDNWFILDEEPDTSVGVASTLKWLAMKGDLDKVEEKKPRRSSTIVEAGPCNYKLDDKYEKNDDNRGTRHRGERHGPVEAFEEKVNYKPEVKLEYTDDAGRVMSAKEAFRHMSHKFHGIESGKKKTEKRLKKQEQEDAAMKMSSDDTPLNTVKLMKAKQKKTQMPYIVINSGSGKKPGHLTDISK